MNTIANATNLTGKTNIGFSSSSTWTCPTGVTQIMVQLWGGAGGAGADGGYYYNGSIGIVGCGGKGGRGGYNMAIINVVPGNVYSISIGTGGTGGSYNRWVYIGQIQGTGAQTSATDGQSSSFGGNILNAQGGTAGSSSPATTSNFPLASGNDGVNGTVINYQSNLVSFNTFSQVSSNMSYIPTGYLQSTLTPNPFSVGGVPAGVGAIPVCYAGDYPLSSGSGENGFCVISY